MRTFSIPLLVRCYRPYSNSSRRCFRSLSNPLFQQAQHRHEQASPPLPPDAHSVRSFPFQEPVILALLPSITAKRTSLTNPRDHTSDQEGFFYSVPPEHYDKYMVPRSFRPSFRKNVDTFGECSLMIRAPGLQIIDYINRSNLALPPVRYVLFGRDGVGKSLVLLYLLHYFGCNDWVIFHAPIVSHWTYALKELQESTFKPGRVDLPLESVEWLQNFLQQNGNILRGTPESPSQLAAHQKYVWSKREETLPGSPLLDIVELGIKRARLGNYEDWKPFEMLRWWLEILPGTVCRQMRFESGASQRECISPKDNTKMLKSSFSRVSTLDSLGQMFRMQNVVAIFGFFSFIFEFGTEAAEDIHPARYANDCIGVIVKELKLSATESKAKVAVVMDVVNAIWSPTIIPRVDKSTVPPEALSTFAHFKNILKNDWKNGVIVTAVDRLEIFDQPVLYDDSANHFPRHLLRRAGFEAMDPFIPVVVSDYNLKELTNCIDYYLEKRWLSHPMASTEKGRDELRFVSGMNPENLYRLSAFL